MSKYIKVSVQALADAAGNLVGLIAPNGNEYLLAVAPVTPNNVTGATGGVTSLFVQAAGAGAGTTLTNPLTQCVNSVNNYTQSGIQNLLNGANSSADHVAYPDNISNDGTGFADIGITSSGFAQAAYSVTGPNEPYVFGSSPSGNATASGDMVFATDLNGTSNGMRWYVNGFTKAIGAWSMKLNGNGMFTMGAGMSLANLSKVVVSNGAATTYTVPAGASYVYILTTAASLAITLPAAAASIDGLVVVIVPNNVVAAVTWVSAGSAAFVGAPTALATNTPVRWIYDHASLKWYPA